MILVETDNALFITKVTLFGMFHMPTVGEPCKRIIFHIKFIKKMFFNY